ncbi:MAG: ABC transporter substrate-binding protein [Burkholderiaceae bacterium]
MDQRHLLSRRTVLAGAAAMAAFGGSGHAQTLEKVRYLTPFGYIMGFTASMYAESGGFFAKQGLDVEIIGGRGSAMSVQQISAGNVLVSRTGGTDLIKAAVKDPSIVAFAEIYQRDIFHVISSQAKPINTPADMAGKTIGVVSVGGATENILDMMLAKGGIPSASVKRETVGNAPTAFEFIGQGRIDAFIATNDTVAQLKVDGRPAHTWSTDTIARCPGQVYITSRKMIAEKPETLARFLRGVHAALGALVSAKDFQPILQSMSAKYEIAEAKRPDKGLFVLKSAIEGIQAPYRDKLASSTAAWQSAYDLMIQAKIIEPVAKPDFYSDAIVKRAFG